MEKITLDAKLLDKALHRLKLAAMYFKEAVDLINEAIVRGEE